MGFDLNMASNLARQFSKSQIVAISIISKVTSVESLIRFLEDYDYCLPRRHPRFPRRLSFDLWKVGAIFLVWYSIVCNSASLMQSIDNTDNRQITRRHAMSKAWCIRWTSYTSERGGWPRCRLSSNASLLVITTDQCLSFSGLCEESLSVYICNGCRTSVMRYLSKCSHA